MMAEPKTKPTEESVVDFLNEVADEQRRRDCFVVLDLMREVTGVEPRMWGSSIVGFGSYKYGYASGKEAEWPIAAFSPRKTELTLYLVPGFESATKLMTKLGKHKTGKSCLYLKRLDDVDLSILKELVTKSLGKMASKRVS